jgi:predicted Fe-S protein YdhL (DUF1289 family)
MPQLPHAPLDPTADRPDSPCIGVCVLDDAGNCIGCLRTSAEVTLWTRMNPAQQWAVVLDLPNRTLPD